MAKAKKVPKERIPNRAQYSRISYLYQAATYLAAISSSQEKKLPQSQAQLAQSINTSPEKREKSEAAPPRLDEQQPQQSQQLAQLSSKIEPEAPRKDETPSPPTPLPPPNLHPLSRRLMTEMRRVALKTQIRLDPSVKRTVCKFCDSLISTEIDGGGGKGKMYVENKSKGGKKPWADTLVVKCGTCGSFKRYPVGRERQEPRGKRKKREKEKGTADASVSGQMLKLEVGLKGA